jgi:beta-aspartyl-peptidase (threonine type)
MPDLTACAQRGRAQPSALDAVELAVVALEEHPSLNAGYGATLNRDGKLELDAAIADGTTGRHGGVAAVRVRNPISLARRVLAETPHVLMVSEGAMELGRDMEILETTTPEQQERYQAAEREGRLGQEDYAAPEHVDTVGAVALDPTGSLAAGSSTGGVFGKLPGRVGDSAIPGAGTFASKHAAVVGTGVGEAFLETLACFRVARLIEDDLGPQEACERIVSLIARERGVSAGLLALSRDGEVGAAFHGGAWAVAGPNGALDAVKVD